MSQLQASFEQRQTQVFRATPSVAGGTISSYDVNSLTGETFPDYNGTSTGFEDSKKAPTIYNLQSCSEVKIGEKVTQIYNNCMSHVK